MTDITDAVIVETTPVIDYAELGRYVASKVPSDEQAQFFIGFYEEVLDLQLAHIGAEAIFDGHRPHVAEVYAALASFISQEGTK